MPDYRVVGFAVAVQLAAIAAADLLPLPGPAMWLGVLVALGIGFVGGYLAGSFADGGGEARSQGVPPNARAVDTASGWRTRARAGLLAGAAGGLAFGVVLWLNMSHVLPRARHGALWAINLLVATHPVGSARFPWLYTGDTLALPVVAASVLLFAAEGYVAGAAAPGQRRPAILE